MWEFDCKRLDMIHIYAFIVCTLICWLNMSLRYRKFCDTNSHPHHNEYLLLRGRVERMFWSILFSLCCDVITRYIHGSQKGHLCMWLAIIYFPSPCWEKFLNGVKKWRVAWEELHQHPVVGSKPLLDDVGRMETDIVPNITHFGRDPCRECLKRWQDNLYCMAQ